MHGYVRLHSGIKFHVRRPTLKTVNLDDIVWGLSHLNRFGGHTDAPLSVAQHACHVHDLAPAYCKREALHHDDAEGGGLIDLPSPIKDLLPGYRDLEVRYERLIARAFGLQYPWPADVKRCDLIALADEMRCLTNRTDWRELPFPPSGARIKVWTPARARNEFMKRHRLYEWPKR